MVKYNYTSQRNPNRQRKTVPSNRAVINKRYNNAPVRKALAKKTTKPKPAPAANKNAIMTLSKQVKMLQLQRYGFKQFQHQHISEITGSPLNFFNPTVTKPYAFLVNDFYTNSKIWSGGITSGTPTLTEQMKFTKVTNDLDIGNSYLWNNKQQQESVSTIHYMPVTSTLKFRVQFISDPLTFNDPVRVRIQVFKFKNQTVDGKFKMSLPYNLGAYWHMCDKDPTTRNHLNTHEYHDLVVDKSVYITPKFDHNNTTTLDRYINCKMFFPAKEVKLDLTTDPASQQIYNVIPTKDQYWCLISTDTADPARLKIYLERWNVWRDQNGVGS